MLEGNTIWVGRSFTAGIPRAFLIGSNMERNEVVRAFRDWLISAKEMESRCRGRNHHKELGCTPPVHLLSPPSCQGGLLG